MGVVEVKLLFCDGDVAEVFEGWECFSVFARQVFILKNLGVREVCMVYFLGHYLLTLLFPFLRCLWWRLGNFLCLWIYLLCFVFLGNLGGCGIVLVRI